MIVPVMAILNLELTQQIYSEDTNGAHAHNRDRVPLRAIFWENRKSQDTREKIDFFLFCQNIPFSTLIQEKIVLGSSDSLYGRNYKKFEKSIFCWFFVLKTTESDRNFEKTLNA